MTLVGARYGRATAAVPSENQRHYVLQCKTRRCKKNSVRCVDTNSSPILSSRQHLSNDDCLGDNRVDS